MNIIINKQEFEQESIPKYFKPINIICPKCNENAKINLTEYKILSQCKNGHNIGNILLHEHREKQRIDLSKIICSTCKENNKGSTFNNIFFRCNSCKINLCPLCKNNHDKNHNIINYDEKDYNCDIDNEKISSYCNTCEKNICLYCNNHDKHKILDYKEIVSDILFETKKIEKLKEDIKQVINKIDFIINRIKIVKDNFEYYYEINKNNLILLTEKKINYEILYNYNNLRNSELEQDMDFIIKSKDINENFRK